MIEVMIQAFESYNKISTKLKISHSKAKELVNQYFNHDVSKITEYEMRVKELLRSNMSEIRKTHKRKPRTIYEMLTSSKIVKKSIVESNGFEYYVVWQNKEEVYDEHVEKLLERIISLNRRG